jgi:hypothetical protein
VDEVDNGDLSSTVRMAVRKAVDVDQSGHAAYEGTQYVTSTLRVRNISLKTSEGVLLELFSQVLPRCWDTSLNPHVSNQIAYVSAYVPSLRRLTSLSSAPMHLDVHCALRCTQSSMCSLLNALAVINTGLELAIACNARRGAAPSSPHDASALLQGGRVNSMAVTTKHSSKVAEVAYADVTGALGAFLLFYHCVVLDGRALLVDVQLEQPDESVTVADQYISQVLVHVHTHSALQKRQDCLFSSPAPASPQMYQRLLMSRIASERRQSVVLHAHDMNVITSSLLFYMGLTTSHGLLRRTSSRSSTSARTSMCPRASRAYASASWCPSRRRLRSSASASRCSSRPTSSLRGV